ncbi:hypothetical protein ACFLXI_00435 [Chloroflexota bacterium]
MADPKNKRRINQMHFGLSLTGIGFFVFTLGAAPEFYGLDRSPVVGFVQIAVFLIGLGMICLGGYASLSHLWKGHERTLAADIGLRLVATGYVVSAISGMADVFGMGTQPWPQIPIFGFWQTTGVMIGQIIIAIGFILLIPPRSFPQEN